MVTNQMKHKKATIRFKQVILGGYFVSFPVITSSLATKYLHFYITEDKLLD